MEYRVLEINVLSARDLKDVNFMSKMDVYVVASIDGDPYNQKQKMKTSVDHDGGKNPTWNSPMKFTINEAAAQQNRLMLEFTIRCERALGDRDVGVVVVPIKELLCSTEEQEGKKNDNQPNKLVTYQVRRPSGRAQGELSLSYKMGEKLISETARGAATAYPVGAGPSSSHLVDGPYPPAAYPPPPPPPQPQGYGYPPPPPPQHGGYGYPYPPPQPPPQSGYGYAAPPPPGYGYAQPVQQPANNKSKFGMGLGAGLVGGALGGLLIGDMVSDAAGFDDGGGFDF